MNKTRLVEMLEALSAECRSLARAERASLTLEEAKKVIEELRIEDAVRNDMQRALA